jgi:tetratricopeptide (TPR) repeat protein
MAPARFRQEVRLQIETIIARGALGTSARQASLLRYLVEQELDGSGARIKAYTIGTDVFGRPRSFDPDNDSIVRTEMARLRKALALHNATLGLQDPVRISFAPGTFRPCIEFPAAGEVAADADVQRQGVSSAAAAGPSPVPPSVETPDGAGPRAGQRTGLQLVAHAGLVLGLSAIFIYAVWSQFGREPAGTGSTRMAARPQPTVEAGRISRPVLAIRPVQPISQDDPQERHAAQHLTGDLVGGLAGNSWLSVESRSEIPGSPMSEPDYRMTLDATVDLDEKEATLVVRLRKDASDTVLWTRRYQTQTPMPPPQVSQQLASTASAEIGRLFGPLSEMYIGAAIAAASTAPSAVSCTMLGYAFLRSVSRQLLDEAETCLMAALPRNEWSPELHAMLALIKLERLDFQPMTAGEAAEIVRLARRHVERARQLGPGLLIVRIAMIVSDYFGDDHDRLREELEKVIRAEPNNAVASFYYIIRTAHVLGDWDRAISHNERAMAVMPEHPRRSRIVALQHALVHNDLPRARRVVDQISTIRTPRVALARLATAGLSHDRQRVALEKGKLADLGVADAEQMLLLARNMRVAEVARPVIIDGLNKAFEIAGPR